MKCAALLMLLTMNGCAQYSTRVPAAIHHAVFITLSDPADAEELVADCGKLGDIPGVAAWSAGRPVDTGRPTVDAAYHAGLYVAFRSSSDYQTYLNHPVHTALVDKWKPRWASIMIRDFGAP